MSAQTRDSHQLLLVPSHTLQQRVECILDRDPGWKRERSTQNGDSNRVARLLGWILSIAQTATCIAVSFGLLVNEIMLSVICRVLLDAGTTVAAIAIALAGLLAGGIFACSTHAFHEEERSPRLVPNLGKPIYGLSVGLGTGEGVGDVATADLGGWARRKDVVLRSQGFLFSPAVPAADFSRFLEKEKDV